MEKKIKTICVDTLTAIQTNDYMAEKGKANHDKWRDFGQDIYNFVVALQDLGFTCVLVLGTPGTGKSFSMKQLPTQTNIWYNADKKNPTWKGGKEEYGTKQNPIAPYHVIPKSYSQIINHVKTAMSKNLIADNPIAFITGHTETYKEGHVTKYRLKTLGNMATNMNIEGLLEVVLYTDVRKEDGVTKYYFMTQNDGFNSGRSYEELFETELIPNDYQLVIDALSAY